MLTSYRSQVYLHAVSSRRSRAQRSTIMHACTILQCIDKFKIFHVRRDGYGGLDVSVHAVQDGLCSRAAESQIHTLL